MNWFLASYINSYVYQEINAQLEDHLSSIEMQLERRNSEIENITKSISIEPDIRRALHLNSNRGSSQTLNRLISIYPFFNYILLIDQHGEIFSSSTRDSKRNKLPGEQLLGLQLTSYPEFSTALQQQITVMNIQKDPFSGHLGINSEGSQWFIIPVHYRNGIIGWVVVSYRWKQQTSRLLNEVRQLLTEAGYPVTGLWIEKDYSTISGEKYSITHQSASDTLSRSHSILIPEETALLSIALDEYKATGFFSKHLELDIDFFTIIWVDHFFNFSFMGFTLYYQTDINTA